MMTRTLKALAIAATLAGATVAYAYQPPTDPWLGSAAVGARADGFDRVVFEHRGDLETRGREITFVVLLQAGADYQLAARCGADCVNLNLSLRDAAGREVAAAGGGNGQPGFNVRAPHSGAYVVTLALDSCRTPRCDVGAVVLGRSTPAPDA
jgi:hypothetical protein